MPLKKINKKKKRNFRDVKSMSDIIPQPSRDSIINRDFDIVTDLNDDFFYSAYNTVQNLVETKNFRDASRVRKLISLLYNVHQKYKAELSMNATLIPEVQEANAKLSLALELTDSLEKSIDRITDVLAEQYSRQPIRCIAKPNTYFEIPRAELRSALGMEVNQKLKPNDNTP